MLYWLSRNKDKNLISHKQISHGRVCGKRSPTVIHFLTLPSKAPTILELLIKNALVNLKIRPKTYLWFWVNFKGADMKEFLVSAYCIPIINFHISTSSGIFYYPSFSKNPGLIHPFSVCESRAHSSWYKQFLILSSDKYTLGYKASRQINTNFCIFYLNESKKE